MNKPIEKGSRKLAVARQTALFLLLGLLVTLVASGYFKMDTSVCVQAYTLFVLGLVGKDGVFMYGNTKEYSAQKPTT